MKIIRNDVLIRPNPTNKIIFASGHELYLDTRFEEQKNAPQSGIVIQVPEKLSFSNNPESPSLSIDTDMELEIGDTVIFNYNAVPFAKSIGKEIDGNYLIPYDMIYVSLKYDPQTKGISETKCLGGTVIVEPISEEEELKNETTRKLTNLNLYIPPSMLSFKSRKMGYVKFASKLPHRANRFQPDFITTSKPIMVDKEGFKAMERWSEPGDKVLFHFANAIPLQHFHEIHGTLSKSVLYRMKHSDIELVIKD